MAPEAPESLQPVTTSAVDFSISVAFEPDPKTDSIIVDFEDTSGKQERYELRSKPKEEKLAEEDTDVLSDISIVAVDEK
jgi:hypothetical protein